MNGTSRCLILRLSVGPTLICRPLQLTTPDELLSLPTTIPLPKLPTLVGSLERLEIGEKWSCSSILSRAANALSWHSPVIRCRQSMRQATSCSGRILTATVQPTVLCSGCLADICSLLHPAVIPHLSAERLGQWMPGLR